MQSSNVDASGKDDLSGIGNDDIGDITLTYNPKLTVDQALVLIQEMTSKLKNKFDVAPSDQRGVRIGNGVLTGKKRLDNISSGLGVLIPIIGFGTLIAGILGISNIMIFIVKYIFLIKKNNIFYFF